MRESPKCGHEGASIRACTLQPISREVHRPVVRRRERRPLAWPHKFVCVCPHAVDRTMFCAFALHMLPGRF
jgi:hypothetical protein